MIREYGTDKIRYEKRDDHLLYYGLRIVNFRPLILLALAVAFGILCGFSIGLYALFINTVILVPLCILLFWKKNRRNSLIALLTVAAMCVLFSVGLLSFGMRIAEYEKQPTVSGDCLVSGVLEQIDSRNGHEIYIFKDLEIVEGKSGKVIHSEYRMKLFRGYSQGKAVSLGERVRFAADVTTYETRSYGRLNASAMLKKIRYRAMPASDAFESEGKERADVFETVDEYLRKTLFGGMQKQNASIAYAMLSGNSGLMDNDVLQNFRYGGIAHIFAVSGLHIGILYAVLNILFKKMHMNRWVRFALIVIFLVLYSGVCKFSPSSVRALIMCAVLAAADCFGFQYDIFNAFSLAVLLILLLNPIHLFSVGFQLSAAAAGGISVIGGHISRCLQRYAKCPQKISAALGTAAAVQICTFPILIDSFGFVSAVSLLLNLIFIPIISLVYAFLFCSAVLAMVLPFAAQWILLPSEYFLQIAVLPTVAELKIWMIGGFSFGICSVVWYVWVIFLSDKINFRPWFKAIVSVVLCAILIVSMCARNLFWNVDGIIALHGYYGSNFAVVREGDSTAVIAFGIPEEDHVEQIFLKEGIRKIDALIPLGSAQTVNNAIPVFLRHASIGTVYMPQGNGFINSFQMVQIEQMSGFFEWGESSLKFETDSILYMNSRGIETVFGHGSAPENTILPHCDVLITESDEQYAERCVPKTELYFEKVIGKSSVYRYGDLQLLRRDDIICVKENV